MSKRLIIAILALFMAGTAFAQLVPTSKMEGKVVDSTGAPLPGVSVEATSPRLVGKATAVTDGDGAYRLFSLPSGVYEVTFTLQGFKTLIRKEIVVQLSQTITLNATLEQAALEEQVTVVGQSPLIDVKSTVKSQTMTKEVFMSLPRNRSFDGLISTVPGVQYDNRTGGLSVDGATGTENMWYMDGADITQPHVGTNAQGAVMELVDEVKVTASGYNAEFGGSMGGVVNVITRSGGNAYHGDVSFYYNDNSRLMQGKSRQYFRWDPNNSNIPQYVNDDDLYWQGGNARDDYKRFEGVFTLGGYILRDKLWFFGSVNPVYSRTWGNRFFNSDRVLPTDPLPLYPFFNKNLVFNGQIKLTAAPLRGLRVSASAVNNWSNYRGAIPSILGNSTKNYAYQKQGYDYPNWSGAFLADYSASNNFLVSLRGGYHQTNTIHQQIANRFTTYYFNYENLMFASDPFYVANPNLLTIAGAVNYGGSRSVQDRYKLEKYSGNLDLSYFVSLAGEHAWKAGFQVIRDQEDVLNGPVSPMVNISWDQTCTALEAYGTPPTRGTYGYYDIRGSWRQPYGYAWKIHRNTYAMYLQDSWTLGGKLTLNAGLRTESEYIPTFNPNVPDQFKKPINFGFADKLAPRFGAVYDVFGDSTLKVFGSFGIYYDVMKLYMAEGAFGGFKWQTDYYTLDVADYRLIAANGLVSNTEGSGATGNAALSQAAGGTYLGTIDWRIPSFDTLQPDMKPVAQQEVSLGAEKKLTEDLSFSARGVWKHLLRTIEDIGIITPQGEQYYEGNPGSPWIVNLFETLQNQPTGLTYWPQPKAIRNYYGLNLSLEKRFSHNWQGAINYTLSLTKGNYGGLSSTDEFGRNSPNVERSFDLWFMMYQMDGTPINGRLPQDRTHYIKAYGSYTFPMGLTLGFAAYGRSGNPISTQLGFNNSYIYPLGYGDLGNLPFTAWADIYAEWAIKVGGRYTVAFNTQISNVTNTKTFQQARYAPTRQTMSIPDALLLDGTAVDPNTTAVDTLGHTYYWKDRMAFYFPDVSYVGSATAQATPQKGLNSAFGTWSVRFGARFSF
ncbi:MAG: TonB-dependent receptor [Candidatus Aminicenantes bacterium RBG_16_66_30]